MTDKIDMMVAQVRESNTACQAGDFEKAVGLYTEAIALDKCNHILYSNRLDYSSKWSCVLFLSPVFNYLLFFSNPGFMPEKLYFCERLDYLDG